MKLLALTALMFFGCVTSNDSLKDPQQTVEGTYVLHHFFGADNFIKVISKTQYQEYSIDSATGNRSRLRDGSVQIIGDTLSLTARSDTPPGTSVSIPCETACFQGKWIWAGNTLVLGPNTWQKAE